MTRAVKEPCRLLDMVELGVDRFRALQAFKAAAATVQVGNKVGPSPRRFVGGRQHGRAQQCPAVASMCVGCKHASVHICHILALLIRALRSRTRKQHAYVRHLIAHPTSRSSLCTVGSLRSELSELLITCVMCPAADVRVRWPSVRCGSSAAPVQEHAAGPVPGPCRGEHQPEGGCPNQV